MAQQQIKGDTGTVDGNGSLTTYAVPGTSLVTPYSVSATADGSGASGSFLPCLTFRTITGAIIARCPAPGVAAGDTAEVSWFPHVAQTQPADGIKYDVDNTGDWLNVEASGQEGPPGSTIIFTADGDGGFWAVNNGAGGLTLLETGPTGIQIEDDGDGGININDSGTTGIEFFQTNVVGHILFQSHGSGGMTFDDTASAGLNFVGGVYFFNALPTSDPGVTGQIWNNGGVLNVSP